MKKESRTNNAIKNTTITMFCYIMYLVVSFVCRTIFTKKLGAEYLGIGGLFSNILTILSFAELGLGSSLVYHLYKPLADEDHNKVNLYINLYKKIYNAIMLIILILGIGVIPFLKYLVEAPNVKESLVLLYVLYLIQTSTSYLFVYKKTLLTADQKNYVVSLFTEITNLVMNICQCIILIVFENFVFYFLLSIIFGILNNVLCSIYVSRKYKFLNNKVKGKLSKQEVQNLKRDTKGLVMTKIASVAFGGTDNIFISSFIGIKYVGILSNYTAIISLINSMTNKIFYSITASIGNLGVSKNSETKTENVLFKMFFINATIYTYICVGLIILLQEFVTSIWLNNEFFLSNTIIAILIIELYLRSIHFPLHTTRSALGLFSQYKIFFVVAAILNIILDFILVKPFGIAGLLFATIICRGITYIVDIVSIYKFGFKKSPVNYFKLLFKWLVFLFICYLISNLIIQKIVIDNLLGFIVKILIITIVYLILYIILFGRTEDMSYFIELFKNKFLKRKKVKVQ